MRIKKYEFWSEKHKKENAHSVLLFVKYVEMEIFACIYAIIAYLYLFVNSFEPRDSKILVPPAPITANQTKIIIHSFFPFYLLFFFFFASINGNDEFLKKFKYYLIFVSRLWLW